MTFDHSPISAGGIVLGGALAVAVLLTMLPAEWTDRLHGEAATVLRPGETAAVVLRRHARQLTNVLNSHFQSAARVAELEGQLEQSEQDRRRLAAELAAARSEPLKPPGNDDPSGRLLRLQCVPARVLGRQARAFLVRHNLLDVGSQSGVARDDLVMTGPAIIDCGSDAALRLGQLVLSGCQVWGKIVQLGPHTSTVCKLTEPGYRDLVYLVSPGAKSTTARCQGILEGTGGPLCRVGQVEVTEPLAVGDFVYAASGKGLLAERLLYGQVVRLERPTGAAHWEIWMQPAVGPHEPEDVAVLRVELNPLRVAEKR